MNQEQYSDKIITASQAAQLVKSGDRVCGYRQQFCI